MSPFTSHTAKLPDGASIFYSDTGPHPATSSYTTVVIIHGFIFNGHGFEPLHDYAHPQGLRLVIINRKQYPGSSGYSSEEAVALNNRDYIFEDLSQTLTQFLVKFIEASDIPPVNDDGSGGLALLGWSAGCSMAMSLFGNPDTMPTDPYVFLAPYLRNLILYDPPVHTFGLGSTSFPNAYIPLSDPDLKTPEDIGQAFRRWITSFYDMPIYWNGQIEDLQPFKKHSDTVTTWPDDRGETIYSPDAAAADFPLFTPAAQPYAMLVAHKCLYDETLANGFFPNVKVAYISCRRSVWTCVWMAFEAERAYKEQLDKGKQPRKTRFFTIDDANHFFHHHDPERFLSTIKEGLHPEY